MFLKQEYQRAPWLLAFPTMFPKGPTGCFVPGPWLQRTSHPQTRRDRRVPVCSSPAGFCSLMGQERFVPREDWGMSPAAGSQLRAAALGFEQRKLLGLSFLLQHNVGFF